MGLIGTRRDAEFEGHRFTVSRNEVTRGFRVDYDGKRVANKTWSLIGLGNVEGTIEHDGRSLPVKVSLDAGSECSIHVDGRPLKVERTG